MASVLRQHGGRLLLQEKGRAKKKQQTSSGRDMRERRIKSATINSVIIDGLGAVSNIKLSNAPSLSVVLHQSAVPTRTC
eukprot:SAG31_NODE_897_length_11148_cov_15.102815_3_plen_79_part_00